jgi:hypothetical protein
MSEFIIQAIFKREESKEMLERLVKPILDVFDEMDELSNKNKELQEQEKQIKEEYQKKLLPISKEYGENSTKISSLSQKQQAMRSDLSRKMRKANCLMTTVKIKQNGKIKTYGIFCDSSMAMIQELTETKEAEKRIAIERMKEEKVDNNQK